MKGTKSQASLIGLLRIFMLDATLPLPDQVPTVC